MVTSLLLYLLKANLVLLLFAAAYFGLLRRLTFFSLNRFYLLLALGFAAVYPALPVPALLPAEAVAPVAYVVLETTGATGPAVAAPAAAPVNWAALGLAAYGAGTALLLLRLLVQLLSLRRLRRQSRPATVDGQAVRVLPGPVSPFSFGRSIYLNPAQHPAPELAAVLRHELVHVRQWHTLDVLLAQLALAAAWCNPAAWLLRRALLDNLEYLADHAVLATGLDRRAYQYSLLRLSHAAPGPSLVSHFTFPTLKNRVVMMNLPLSSSGKLARYIVAGPLVLAVALGISGARAQAAGPVVPAAKTLSQGELKPVNLVDKSGETRLVLTGPANYYLDAEKSSEAALGQLDPAKIASVRLLKAEQARTLFGGSQPTYIITTKARGKVREVIAFNQQVERLSPLRIGFDAELNPVLDNYHAQATTTTAVDPAEHQLPDGIKAYIAATYPGSKLVGWAIGDVASSKAPHVKYFASVVERNGEKRKVLFNAAQQPVVAPEQKEPGTNLALAQAVKYVDGQLFTGDLNSIAPETIASINIFKGDKARQLFGEHASNGVIVVTTTTNQNREDVRAFNERLNIKPAETVAAAVPTPAAATGTPYLAAPALAYITKNYPDARLMSVTEIKAENGGPMRYQAQIVIGRRPSYVLFDGLGQFISESSTSYSK